MPKFNRFDICEAYYLYGMLYHGGQGTREYAYMGRSMRAGFVPGIGIQYANFDSLSENGKEIFLGLCVKAGHNPEAQDF